MTLFPDAWEIHRVDDWATYEYGAEEVLKKIYYFVPAGGTFVRGDLAVFQHASEQMAVEQFSGEADIAFGESIRWHTTPVFIPDNLADLETSANESQIGCRGLTSEGLVDDTILCTYIAQYEEFAIVFRINTMHKGTMTISFEEIGQIVMDIDGRISSQSATGNSEEN